MQDSDSHSGVGEGSSLLGMMLCH